MATRNKPKKPQASAKAQARKAKPQVGRTKPQAKRARVVLDELTRLAQIAAGMLDGEEVKGIVTPLAMQYIANPDPAHIFLSGDYFDVDHELFLRAKKLMLRLQRLAKLPMSCSLWLPIPGKRQVTCAVQNGPYARYYSFGQERLALPDEMAKAFKTGRVSAAPYREGDRLRTALAPVRDSLGDVVALMELSAPMNLPAPAWS